MKPRRWNRFVVLGLLFGAMCASAAVMMSAGFMIERVWVGGGGSVASSAGFRNTASIGQPLAGPLVGPGVVGMRGGFIQPLPSAPPANSCTAIVDPTQETVCTILGPSGPITVTIPGGSLTGPTSLAVSLPASFPGGSGATSFVPLSLGVSVLIGSTLPLQKPFSVRFTYLDANAPSGDETRLRLAFYDSVNARWVPLAGSADTTANLLTAPGTAFGVLQLIELAPAGDLNRVVVYPNPARFARGDRLITFTNLPADATLGIYTRSGEQIRSLEVNSAGEAYWLGDGSQGTVESGVYLAVVRRGSQTRVLYVAVER